MSPLQVGVLGGMIIAAGLVLAVAAVRPGAPRLSLVLAQLNVTAPVSAAPTGAAQPAGMRFPWWSSWLPPRVVAFAERYLGARDEDLNILGMSRSELAGRKAALALGGLLAPAVFGAVLLVAGDKSGNWKRWYVENIPVAEQRYANWIEEQEQS